MHWSRGARKNSPLLPVSAWLIGLAIFTVVGVEGLLVEAHAAFVYARLSAYISAMLMAALMLGFAALFGLSCALMLWWLDDALDTREVVRAVGLSFWSVGAHIWLGVALLLLEPPVAVTVAEMAQPEAVEARIQDLPAFRWMNRLRYLVAGTFLALVAWLLARNAKPLNAVLAVAFGAGVVAALVSALGLLGSAAPP